MMKRNGKFYRKNEAEVMKMLGLKPTKNSGSGWIEKEDGQSDSVICQLKSTDNSSIKIEQKDIHTLEYNAAVSHKIPVFAIQFLNSNEVFVLVKPSDLADLSKYINTGRYEIKENELSGFEEITPKVKKVVKSSSRAREEFKKENELKYKKKGKSAK